MGADTKPASFVPNCSGLVKTKKTIKTSIVTKDEIILVLDLVIDELRSGYRTD